VPQLAHSHGSLAEPLFWCITVQWTSAMPRTSRRTAPLTRAAARTAYLKERAAALREIAATIDVWSIRDRVLALAEECEQLARLVEKEGSAKSSELITARHRTKPQISRARS
jgi:hypothetical protein